MSETPLSDWAPIAYLQKEEERRRNEQKSAGAAPPEHECCDNDEKRLSGVTVASLQRRFLLLEQRLAILERQEHERQIREKFEAAPAQPPSGTADGGASYFGDAVSIGQREDHSQAKSRPEFTYTKVEKAESIDDRKTHDLHAQSHASDSPRDERSRIPNDFVEIHPLRSGKPIQAGPARRIAAAFSSFAVTAFLAGSMGFMGAILTVPAENATQILTLVNIAVSALSEASRTK